MEDDLKYGWPFPDFDQPHHLFKIRSAAVIPMVGTFSKLLLGWFNNIEAHNVNQFRELIRKRDESVPLITVSNHYSCLDDPCLWAVLRWRDVWNSKIMRWSVAAHDICFTNVISNFFFSSGKCVPVIRGKGVYQKGMDFCLERLQKGEWVHIFPEGKVNMSLERLRLKWGVGRLVYESKLVPLVLPFYHIGMDAVLPNTKPYIPKLGKKVTVVVGEPIDFSPLITQMKEENVDPQTARKIITDRIQDELGKLRDKAEKLHSKRFES